MLGMALVTDQLWTLMAADGTGADVWAVRISLVSTAIAAAFTGLISYTKVKQTGQKVDTGVDKLEARMNHADELIEQHHVDNQAAIATILARLDAIHPEAKPTP